MIYIVDDDLYVLRGLGLLLRSANFDHTTAASAEGFLSIYKPGMNDLLILDMHMPGMNGCELLKALKEHEFHVPTIIITAFDEPSSRDCAKQYGALAYFRKPIDGEALIDVIRYSQLTLST
jgi:FixJ family two-component response regulator